MVCSAPANDLSEFLLCFSFVYLHPLSMKPAPITFCIALAAIGLSHADVPKKASLTKYQNLWVDSPFTAKPVIAGPTMQANVLQNYVLLGVAPVRSGFQVIILNRKDPSKRFVVETNKPNEGFELIEVIENKSDPLATIVKMEVGGRQGTVAFEEKFLVIKNAPAALAKPMPQSPTPAKSNVRSPRPRVLPPSKPKSSNAKKPSSRPDRRVR